MRQTATRLKNHFAHFWGMANLFRQNEKILLLLEFHPIRYTSGFTKRYLPPVSANGPAQLINDQI
jgi:hypothetical protein